MQKPGLRERMHARRTPLSRCRDAAVGLVVAALTALSGGPPPAAVAQSAGDVEVVLGNLPKPQSTIYKRLRMTAGGAVTQKLELTKSEVWRIPGRKVERLTREAAARGVSITRLDATWNHVLAHAPPNTPMTATQAEMMALTMKSTAVMAVDMMASQSPGAVEYALSKDMASPDNKSSPIVLPISATLLLDVRRTAVARHADRYVWRGVTTDTNEPVTIMWWPSGRLAGTASYRGMTYALKNMGGSMHAVVTMDNDRMPAEHGPMRPMRSDDPELRKDPLFMTGDGGKMRPRTGPEPVAPAARPRPSAEEVRQAQDAPLAARSARPTHAKAEAARKSAATKAAPAAKPVEITLMVAYTRRAAQQYSDIRTDLIDLAVEDANQTFRNSGVGHVSLKLVHAHQTDYDETGGVHFDHVWHMADRGDGYMDEIPRLRFDKKADVVVLLVDDPSGCGLATRVAADAEEAYAVVHHACALATYSLAHEIGHILGARHDRSLDQSTGPFPYGHGYVNNTKWRTMMSYKAGCNNCPRLPHWSNPDVKYNGEATGTEMANNARVIAEQAERVARFRTQIRP